MHHFVLGRILLLVMEHTINPYEKGIGKKVISIRGNSVFSDSVRKVSAEETESEGIEPYSTIQFVSSTEAVIVINGNSFPVKLSNQEHTDVFKLNSEDDSLDFVGKATKRGMVMSSSKGLINKVKPLATQPETKQAIEVMSMSKVLNSSTSSSTLLSTVPVNPPLSVQKFAASGMKVYENEEAPLRKKQKVDTPRSSSVTIRHSTDSQQLEDPVPESLFVKIENLSFDVKIGDIRKLLNGLKFAAFHFCLNMKSKTYNVYVVFESKYGFVLALGRSGEYIGETKKKSKIVRVSQLHAVWAAHTSFWIDLENEIKTKLNFWPAMLKALEKFDLHNIPLNDFLQLENASEEWMHRYNNCNVYGGALHDEAFALKLIEIMDIKNLASNEKIIESAVSKVMSVQNSSLEDLNEIQIHMLELANMILATMKLQRYFEVDSAIDSAIVQLGFSWSKRIQRLLEGLYILFWKLNLFMKLDDL